MFVIAFAIFIDLDYKDKDDFGSAKFIYFFT